MNGLRNDDTVIYVFKCACALPSYFSAREQPAETRTSWTTSLKQDTDAPICQNLVKIRGQQALTGGDRGVRSLHSRSAVNFPRLSPPRPTPHQPKKGGCKNANTTEGTGSVQGIWPSVRHQSGTSSRCGVEHTRRLVKQAHYSGNTQQCSGPPPAR